MYLILFQPTPLIHPLSPPFHLPDKALKWEVGWKESDNVAIQKTSLTNFLDNKFVFRHLVSFHFVECLVLF